MRVDLPAERGKGEVARVIRDLEGVAEDLRFCLMLEIVAARLRDGVVRSKVLGVLVVAFKFSVALALR